MEEQDTLVGTRLGGNSDVAWWDDVYRQFGAVIPPYPSPPRFKLAVMPAPPRLQQAATDDEAVEFIAKWYRSALRHYYPHINSPAVDIANSHAAELIIASDWLRKFDIAPVAWVGFSIHVWREYAKPRNADPRLVPPAAAWVLSAKRIAQAADWFVSEEPRWRGGHTIVVPAHVTAINGYHALMQRLRTTGSENAVWAYAARVPALSRTSHAEADELMTAWRKSVDAGVYLWV